MAMSVVSVVVSKDPWTKLFMTTPMRVPRPTWPMPAAVPTYWLTKSSKSIRAPLKPTVLTLEMLLPMTFIFSP